MTADETGQIVIAGGVATPSYQRPDAGDVEHAQDVLFIPPEPIRKGPAPMPGQTAMFDGAA